jgi:hypothetical protein
MSAMVDILTLRSRAAAQKINISRRAPGAQRLESSGTPMAQAGGVVAVRGHSNEVLERLAEVLAPGLGDFPACEDFG